MNMQALQQDTLLKGGKYRIEKILNETDFEITYLSDRFGSDNNVTITEFFMKNICGRDGNRVTYGSDDTQNDAIRMRDKFKKDAEAQDNIELFEENDTVYYVREYKDESVAVADDNIGDAESDNNKDTKKPSLLKKLKWPLIVVAVLGAGAAFFVTSEPPVKEETTTVNSGKKVETKTVETKKQVPVKVEKESAAFASLMEKMNKVKKDALSIPGVSQHKVLTELSNVKDEFEKTKSKLSADEQERFHKAFQEVIEIVKKRS